MMDISFDGLDLLTEDAKEATLVMAYGTNHLKVNTHVQIKPLPKEKSPALFLCRIYSKWWSEEILLRVFFNPQNWVRYIQDLAQIW